MLTISAVLLIVILLVNTSANSVQKLDSNICLTPDCIKEGMHVLKSIDVFTSFLDDISVDIN